MVETQNQKKLIIVGDVTMDWNIARTKKSPGDDFSWNPEISTTTSCQRGGAALLADMISQLLNHRALQGQNDFSIFQYQPDDGLINPTNPNIHHSYSIWSQFPNGKTHVWRVSEFLGLDRNSRSHANDSSQFSIANEPETADILVMDDAAIGFRDFQEVWPKCLFNPKNPPWILLKMSQPVGQGPLWEHLVSHFADRLILLSTVSDLRRTEVQISKGLSWERTAQDVIWELEHNPQINSMSQCASVIISFGTAGAVVHQRLAAHENPVAGLSKTSQLVFDPAVIEGEWIEQHPGGMIGYTTCLAAGIVQSLMLSQETADLLSGVQTGLYAMRDLHLGGYENVGSEDKPRLHFPHERIVHHLTNPGQTFAVVDIQDPVRFLFTRSGQAEQPPEEGYWSILQERYQGDLDEICEQIVVQGAETSLIDVPQGRFGGLFTVDRQEIESFRSISSLVKEYLNQSKPKRPLSIGVFGAPGSGKSFGITQVAKSLAHGRIVDIEFNLSQFESTDELVDALHQVRDINLSGKFPLVFWDEFDTTFEEMPLGWLRYFLAPMQDGEFREGQVVHPIGPAIFVFAGGTSEQMASFGIGLNEELLRNAKVPDFISRLKGFVNIQGPNPKVSIQEGVSFHDPFFKIRRAILIRSILWRNERHLFQEKGKLQLLKIDSGVLRAFLNVSLYKHGIRSMESIVAMSRLTGKSKFERSSLPPEAQLDLHVDGQEFLSLVQQINLTQEMLDKLAAAFHDHFCSNMRQQGYVYGEVTNDDIKTHSSLKTFEDLPEDEQEQNRDTVRHIYRKLTASGYIMIPARSNELPFEFPGQYLERLAIMEHDRWMELKFTNGWEYAPETDKTQKKHSDLVPWDQLSNHAKQKDIDFVLVIPKILAKAGYTVVELRPMKPMTTE